MAELRERIRSGELRPGQRLPSVRQIAARWGVAIATATKVVAALRDEGAVETKVGSGSVVSVRVRPRRPTGPARRPAAPVRQPLSRKVMLRAAIVIADAEGLEAVSMRRIAAEMGVGPMSLYRHVESKDDLVRMMADEVFAEAEPPDPGPGGWRAKLELIARLQWALCRQHLWLPRVVSFTRPAFAPNLMAHTEWTLRALDGLGLPITTRMREALTLHSLVVTAGLSLAAEAEAEAESGLTLARWVVVHQPRAEELFAGGRFPLLAQVREDTAADHDGLFEYSLARHLDGFAALLDQHGA